MRKYFVSSDDFFYIMKTALPSVKKVKLISTGWTNFVYVASSKKGRYIFRFPRNDFFSQALVKECTFVEEMSEHKLSFKYPKLQLKYYKHRPYSMHRQLAGKSLSDCKLSKRKKERLAKDVCLFMQELQNIKPKMKLKTTSQFLANLSKVSGKGVGYDLSNHAPLIQAEKDDGLVLTHGDLNPGNIIIKHGRMVGVLDFAFVSFSSPLDDLARLIGRSDESYFIPLKNAFKRAFKMEIRDEEINSLISVWDYVEEKYVDYIRREHPDILLPEKFS